MLAQLYGMQTEEGVHFRDLLAVQVRLGPMQAFVQDRLQRLDGVGWGDVPFSVRRGSNCFIMLETVLLQLKDHFYKNRGKIVRIGLKHSRRGPLMSTAVLPWYSSNSDPICARCGLVDRLLL